MIYTFTGNVTSLNDFKVSEIQNPEGRFVAKTPPSGAGGFLVILNMVTQTTLEICD